MNITTSKQAEKLAEIGAQFKRIREDKELSIPYLTATTLISERYLRAIEEGEIQSLPEPVYIRGFIRKYGVALGVGDLSEDFPLSSVLPENKWVGSPAAELRPLHLYALYIAVIASAVGLLATFLNPPEASKISDSQTNFSDAARLQRAKPQSTALISLSPQSGGLGVLKQSTIAPPSASTNLATNLAKTASAEVIEGQVNVGFNNIFKSWAANASLTKQSAIAVDGKFKFAPNKPLNVGIIMQGQSWVRIIVDDKTEFEGVLDEGKNLAWSGDRQIAIRAGNAAAVALSYNNQPAKVLGRDGEVAERLFSAHSGHIEANLWVNR